MVRRKAAVDEETTPVEENDNGPRRSKRSATVKEEPSKKQTRGRKKKDDKEQEEAIKTEPMEDVKVKVEPPEENSDDVALKPIKGRKRKAAPKENVPENEDEGPSTSSASAKVSRKAKKEIKVEPEEVLNPTATPGGKKGRNKQKNKKISGRDNEDTENRDTTNIPDKKSGIKTGVERSVVVKGQAAVDALCPVAKTSHVFEEGQDVWDCMLNQTNIQFNNNKYYLIQLLKDDSAEVYSVWMRWGRVGANGQNALHPCGSDLDRAKGIFLKKFSDKTKNDWYDRDNFEKVQGKYDLIEMDYSKGTDETDSSVKLEEMKEKRKKIDCKLEARVKVLIELICNIATMEEAVVEMKYDARKAPLGKLTVDQIKAGYLALKEIEEVLQKEKYKNMELVNACNAFYTRIPHYFGMKVPPLIRTRVEIQEKLSLLEALGDIQAALSIIGQPIDINVHPVDQHYSSLKCEIIPVDRESTDFKVIEKYMSKNHGKTHSQYSLQLLELFECKKEMEYERFKDVGNSMLLWHGSRLSNWAGILSQGLRIAPPEAPSTGYMFGKGIYFADMASKSANYCWATQRNDVGLLLLSEVSLGKTNDLLDADYNANKLPSGRHSVKGCGRYVPPEKNFTKLSDGTVVPMGPAVDSGMKNKGYTLMYNEYIVYDPAQVRTRYLLKVKFKFK